MAQDVLATATLLWLAPSVKPSEACGVLVVYGGVVYAGVYAKGRVVRYPEDFEPVRLTDCSAWCRMPDAPKVRR